MSGPRDARRCWTDEKADEVSLGDVRTSASQERKACTKGPFMSAVFEQPQGIPNVNRQLSMDSENLRLLASPNTTGQGNHAENG